MGCPDAQVPRSPSTKTLFLAIACEAEACLQKTDWETRVRRIENILSVIKWRIREFWEEQHESELDRLIEKKKGEILKLEK